MVSLYHTTQAGTTSAKVVRVAGKMSHKKVTKKKYIYICTITAKSNKKRSHQSCSIIEISKGGKMGIESMLILHSMSLVENVLLRMHTDLSQLNYREQQL